MPTTSQMLADYPDILLQVLAEMRAALLDVADTRAEAVELLAAQITDPVSVQIAYQELIESYEPAKEAIDLLLTEGGEVSEAQFARAYGSVRQMGPARLEREQPWLVPESMAEVLYYYGLIGRGYRGAGQRSHTVVYLPSDIVPWLPHPQGANEGETLPVTPAPPPHPSRTMLADDSFLADMGALLGFIHTEGLRIEGEGPHPDDIERVVERLQVPFTANEGLLNARLALMLHLANRLGWLRRTAPGVVGLTGNQVRTFLAATRAEQRASLWRAWCESPDWNDLCRTPTLECADTGAWRNDPLQTRSTLLQLIGRLQPGVWYSQADVIHAIHTIDPDFQRPTANYDTWYIRDTNTQEFLKGFEQWDGVEGALLRFLCQGPLHWLGAMDLAEPSAGDDMQISLSQWGARWLGHEDVPQPHEAPRKPMVVEEDFTVSLSLDAPLDERFRIERFTQWQSSYPRYVYQINQRSLQRAANEGITAERILAMLEKRTRSLPPKVAGALGRMAA